MPTFTFEGFTEGSLVALSAAQGAQGAAGSVPGWRLSNMNSATIDFTTETQTEVVAPAGVWFEAGSYSGFNVSEDLTTDQTYDPSEHGIFHAWDFDDAGTFNTVLNMPTAWNNKNVDYGKRVYHVFDTPGTYSVTLWAVDSEGNVGVRTKDVVVQDPAVLYSGSRTICVSNQSDWTGAPAGAQQVTSLSAAQSAFAALGQTGRILLKRGETYNEQVRWTTGMANWHVGAYGPGSTKPVVTTVGNNTIFAGSSNSASNPADIIHWGIRFAGDWDATQEVGDPRGSPVSYNNNQNVTGYHYILYDCEVAGMRWYMPFAIQAANGGISAVVDCEITSWQDYGITHVPISVDGLRLAVVGCDIHQPENACAGHQGKNGRHNDHGPIRLEWVEEVILSATSMYSANSWFGGTATQPCIRLTSNQSGSPATGFKTNANRVACEGGFEVFYHKGYLDTLQHVPGNHVFDMLLIVADYSTKTAMDMRYGGLTIRNVLAAFPAMSSLTDFRSDAFIVSDNSGSTTANTNAVRRLTHSTVLNLSSQETWGELNTGVTVTYSDNVNHQPNRSVTPDAPVDLTQTIAGFTTRNRGIRNSLPSPSASINLANNASTTFSYPAGTSASDFVSTDNHTINIGGGSGSYYTVGRGDIEVSFGGSNITVTNRSGGTLSGTAYLMLSQATRTTDTAYGSPSTVPLPVPTAAPTAPLTNGVPNPYAQFDTTIRTRARGAV